MQNVPGVRPTRLKPILLAIGTAVLVTCIAPAIFTRLGHVRARWFVFVTGLLGGSMLALAGICAIVACAMGSLRGDWGAALSASWALFSDLVALERGLVQAVPNSGARLGLLAGGAAAGFAIGALTVVAHLAFTDDNLYDEAAGKWYGKPVDVAALDAASRPRHQWRLSAWRPITDPEEFSRRSKWLVLREHRSGLQASQRVQLGAIEERAGLPLVSLACSTVKQRRTYGIFPPRMGFKRAISTEPSGKPFFVSHDELAALKALIRDGCPIPKAT